MSVLRTLVFALALPACGTTTDDRPVTFDVVTLEVIAPSCGQVQCHSSATHLKGYALDTLDNTRQTLEDTGRDGLLQPDETGGIRILDTINKTGGDRMPPDSPLNNDDLMLLENWVNGDQVGL